MKKSRVVAAALIGIAFVSLVGFTSAQSSKGAGKYQTGVFAVVYGYGDWIRLGPTGGVTRLLTLELPNVPVSALYHVVCDGYSIADEAAGLVISIGVDSPTEDESTRRAYGHDPNLMVGIHTERVYYLAAGKHTFYFLGRLLGMSGLCKINYHTITVTIFTDGTLMEPLETAESDIAPDGVSE